MKQRNLLVWTLISLISLSAAAQTANNNDPRGNLAIVAAPTGSGRQGGLLTNLNDGLTPTPRGNTRGNRPPQRLGTQWVQYEWKQAISTKEIAVFWWDFTKTMPLPAAYRIEYWNGNSFVPVQNASGLGLVNNQYNTTTFDEVSTTKL